MSILGIVVSATLAVSAGFPAVQDKAPDSSQSNILAASVDDLAKWVAQGTAMATTVIEIDPRILSPGGRGKPMVTTDLHAPGTFAGAVRDKAVVVMTLERALQCTGRGAEACRTDGRFVTIILDAPAVTGDSATVTAFVRVSRTPTAENRARAQQAANPEVALARMGNEAGSTTMFRLSLAHKDGVWSVVSRQIIGQS